VIDRKGQTYRTLNNNLRANHAGLSMWNGETDINYSSVGIELVGYNCFLKNFEANNEREN
jgi:N-acetylmuramoyl-L-alanine amidase